MKRAAHIRMADKPEYETVLLELKAVLKEYLEDLPGDFDL